MQYPPIRRPHRFSLPSSRRAPLQLGAGTLAAMTLYLR